MKYTKNDLKEIQINTGKNNIAFDNEEEEFLKDLSNAVFIPIENQKEEKEKLYKATINTISKKKAISIKPLESDIFKIKSLALEKGIPYQTFINSILHQVANGTLKV